MEVECIREQSNVKGDARYIRKSTVQASPCPSTPHPINRHRHRHRRRRRPGPLPVSEPDPPELRGFLEREPAKASQYSPKSSPIRCALTNLPQRNAHPLHVHPTHLLPPHRHALIHHPLENPVQLPQPRPPSIRHDLQPPQANPHIVCRVRQ